MLAISKGGRDLIKGGQVPPCHSLNESLLKFIVQTIAIKCLIFSK